MGVLCRVFCGSSVGGYGHTRHAFRQLGQQGTILHQEEIVPCCHSCLHNNILIAPSTSVLNNVNRY